MTAGNDKNIVIMVDTSGSSRTHNIEMFKKMLATALKVKKGPVYAALFNDRCNNGNPFCTCSVCDQLFHGFTYSGTPEQDSKIDSIFAKASSGKDIPEATSEAFLRLCDKLDPSTISYIFLITDAPSHGYTGIADSYPGIEQKIYTVKALRQLRQHGVRVIGAVPWDKMQESVSNIIASPQRNIAYIAGMVYLTGGYLLALTGTTETIGEEHFKVEQIADAATVWDTKRLALNVVSWNFPRRNEKLECYLDHGGEWTRLHEKEQTRFQVHGPLQDSLQPDSRVNIRWLAERKDKANVKPNTLTNVVLSGYRWDRIDN